MPLVRAFLVYLEDRIAQLRQNQLLAVLSLNFLSLGVLIRFMIFFE